ncbi:ATP-dependent DNA helicase RecG [Desulfotomaculum arcticum]|uniref:ATP-dependent DNA helicase RecG n=1 Tax=Desulfotruncus arcticus DSM 17038 TaxID=1121424 RepID=A0A1I2RI27_9FIRM|nr:ATP-dependent DNA helicase RecG [Desulfotruncus arcticus]SFG37511.1 ATP-dependent DNA helicase RecG [Desulfotomaculum arcticum] [Desulfotruncus arcticus DSM 17038]
MNNRLTGEPAAAPIQSVKGIGPRRAGELAKLNIFTVKDMFYHFPREYLDRSSPVSPFGVASGKAITAVGKVKAVKKGRPGQKPAVTKVALETEGGVFYAVLFNRRYLEKSLKTGMTMLVSGKIENRFGIAELQVQDFDIVNDHITNSSAAALHTGRLVPVYPATAGITQRIIRSTLQVLLEQRLDAIVEFLPDRVMEKYGLMPIKPALRQIHFPDSPEQARQAKKRFAFEELLLFQVQLAYAKSKIARLEKPHVYNNETKLKNKLIACLGFALTGAQRRVLAEIMSDLEGSRPMNRLLQGDVGSGKTLVAVLTLLRAVESGLQGALMAPTEVLAEQHYLALTELLEPLGVRPGFLSGGMPAAKRKALLEELAAGSVRLVVGTQALLQEDVIFNRLGVVVIDEQHRFGVKQRAGLREKGLAPDVLVMTATPIPRTLTLTLYGDLDISIIDQLPPGRQPARTYYVNHRELPGVYEFIRKQVKAGRQAYVVCPLVDESEKMDLQAAVQLYERLKAEELRECRLALLTGRMGGDDKELVMRGFREGSVDVLVATTVIEVGVDVPNANVMVIIDAERFGLSQLHQLRGRVGRGGGQSHCILAARPGTREALQRIKAIKTCQDGFQLAEKDLEIRGPGDVAGVRQSGLPEFKAADLLRDINLLKAAKACAEQLIAADPELKSPQNAGLKRHLQQNWQKTNLYHIG